MMLLWLARAAVADCRGWAGFALGDHQSRPVFGAAPPRRAAMKKRRALASAPPFA
jgi:hypothetical protein